MSNSTAAKTVPIQEPLIVFLHIPKTAGTSLSHILRHKFQGNSITRIYTPSDCEKPLAAHAAALGDSVKCISGHIHYGIHQHLSRECHYFSMLRDPVERVLSHYHFTRSKDANSHPLGNIVEFAQNSTIVEYLQHYPAIAFEQIRMVSGINTFDRDALEVAKENVTTGRVKVGLTEDFYQSTELIFHELGLGYPRFAWKRKNTGSSESRSQKLSGIDSASLDAIEDICALDTELYQHTLMHHKHRKHHYQNRQRTLSGKARDRLFHAYCRFLN